MFIACTELFKIGIGPSSSHTMGPMLAAYRFRAQLEELMRQEIHAAPTDCKNHSHPCAAHSFFIRCELFGSLAFTGKGHATDRAVLLGLNGFTPEMLIDKDVFALINDYGQRKQITFGEQAVEFSLKQHLLWNTQATELAHPNTLSFALYEQSEGDERLVFSVRYVSIGGGFVSLEQDLDVQELNIVQSVTVPFPFENAEQMLVMSAQSKVSIAQMKRENELARQTGGELSQGIAKIWQAMRLCVEQGLSQDGILPGSLKVARRARDLYQQMKASEAQGDSPESSEWLSVYAMAVNEENAAGHLVVTAPTNGAAGVIPSVLYYLDQHYFDGGLTTEQLEAFFLTAAAIGGLIKHNSSISGAEVGCQGEVGSAAAMAAAGLCALKGGDAQQIEHAAEIALEHHLGMTCDPVAGLVQVPCIERNAFGAVKAWLAANLALRQSAQHLMSLDACIKAMHQTGMEMSDKYKETSLGGLAASWVEC